MFRSQWGQDRWLEENIFKGQRNGIFVEVGVLDGLSDSNTAFFEFERDWTGLLVEANPQFIRAIQNNRPNSIVKPVAAYNKFGSVSFKVVEGTPGWSGIENEFNDFHHVRVKRGLSHYVSVPCAPLAHIMDGMYHVDYLSVDVEGAEEAIVRDFPFKDFDIRIIGIENNVQTDRVVERILTNNGYKLIHRIEYDDFYEKQ